MVRTREEWAALIGQIASVGQTQCSAIIDDLTLSDRFWDLHVQPFVPVDGAALAVAP